MIGIIGSGVSGLFAARALARIGQQVTLFETDEPAPAGDADQAFLTWKRPGVAQLRQPHAARAFIYRHLSENDPELLAALIANGMAEWKFHLLGVQDPSVGHDPELIGLLGRRSTLEVPLRRIVQATPGVTIVRAAVKGLSIQGQGQAARVTGIVTADGERSFSSVIDASGRRSRIVEWLAASNVTCPSEETVECGITYYSRYYRFLDGVHIPRGPYPSGPSASLPGVSYTMNRTDHCTFSVMLGVSPWREEFRDLRHNAVFSDFVSRLPGANAWLDPAISEPIWKVEPFAGLVNRYRHFHTDGQPLVGDLYVIGDARFHTNPIYGWGMSFALDMANQLAQAWTQSTDPRERLAAFERRADAFARTYYDASSAEDTARSNLWRGGFNSERGEPGSYRYFLTTILPAVFKDQWIFRKVTRRLHLLDAPGDVMQDDEVLRRAQALDAAVDQRYSEADVLQLAREAADAIQTQPASR